MYQTIEDFKIDWLNESQATLKILETITDSSLTTKVYEEGRTLGYIAWHLAYTIGEMMHSSGLPIENFDEHSVMPTQASHIKDAYSSYSESLIKKIETLQDEDLQREIPIYGQEWKISYMLKALVYHQIHHRGQITVLMRQAGLQVPGIYGPSKEEWSSFGMDAQA